MDWNAPGSLTPWRTSPVDGSTKSRFTPPVSGPAGAPPWITGPAIASTVRPSGDTAAPVGNDCNAVNVPAGDTLRSVGSSTEAADADPAVHAKAHSATTSTR